MFGKKGLLLILLVTLFTAFSASAATFSFVGVVAYPNGTICPAANVSLSVPSWLTTANAQWNGSWSNLTNSTGGFSVNVTGYAASLSNLKLNIKYNTTVGSGAASFINGTTFIGPNLPAFPTQMYDGTMNPSLAGQTFYMVRAGSLTLTVLNSTSSGFSNFSYIIRDTTLGSEVASYMVFPPDVSNVTVALPLGVNRNYSISVMLNDGPPLDWSNLTYANFSSYNLSAYGDNNDSIVYYGALQFNATTSITNIDGYLVYPNNTRLVSGSGNANLSKFEIWMSIIEASNFVCMNDNCLMNISRFQMPGGTSISNSTSGYYNYTFAGTNNGLDSLLIVIVNLSNNWYVGLQNVTTTYGPSAQNRTNITMLPIAGSNYVSGTNLKCPQTFIRLLNATGSPLNNIGQAMMELQLDYNISNGGFVPKITVEVNNTGIATFPLSSSYGVKSLKAYASNYPPRDVKFLASAMDGDISMTVYNLQSKSFDGTSNLGATMQMLVSNSTCDVMTPPSSCIVTSATDSAFNPMSAILRGAVSMRLLIPGGMILHYISVDLLSSGPPDFMTDSNAGGWSPTGGTLSDIWRLGSRGPKIYSGVMIGHNYTTTKPDTSVNVTVTLPTLYDSESAIIWNRSANGTGYLNIIGNYSEYADYNNTWFIGQQCDVRAAGTLEFNKCFYNKSSFYLWVYLPHFSVGGEQIQGITAGGVTLNISSVVSCNTNCAVYFNVTNLNLTISPQNENANVTWIINVTSDSAGHRNQSINISYMNATQSWVFNGTNISQYVNYSLTYYNLTNGERIWNTTHQYRLLITRASNRSEPLVLNFTVISSDKINLNLTINLTLQCANVWESTDWSTCSGGTQTRTVTDRSNCGYSYTTAPASSQSCVTGGTGGGGGGGTPSTSVTWTTMTAGQIYTYTVPDTAIAVDKLTIVPNVALTNVKVVVRQLPEMPTSVLKAPIGTTFKYIELAKENILNSDIKSLKIGFKVDKSWVDGKGKKESVVLLRYEANDKWQKLTTRYLGEEAGKYLYEADSPGMSYFAIAFQTEEQETEQQKEEAKAAEEVKSEEAEPENVFEEKESKKSSWWTVVIALVAVLVIVIAFYFVYKHKKKSGGLDGYRYKPR